MKKTAFISMCLTLAGYAALAQSVSISPQVINTAGKDHGQVGSANFYYSDNVGEPFTETYGPAAGMMISQGFLQPIISNPVYSVTILTNSTTCMDKDDGQISIAVDTKDTTVKLQYTWYHPLSPPKIGGNKIDSLTAGTYTVVILASYTRLGITKTDTIRPAPVVVDNSSVPCKITIFTGFTPNNDGVNDVWAIGNIAEFPKNHVGIFNRWGIQVFETTGYNNTTNAWPTQEMLDKLIPSTYFYIIDLGDGSQPYKGWVELIKQ